jgi:hypothetical protein
MSSYNNIEVFPNEAQEITDADAIDANVVVADAEVINKNSFLINAKVINEDSSLINAKEKISDNVKAIPIIPIIPIDLRQRKMTPIDRYVKNINIYISADQNVRLTGEDLDTYRILERKLDSIYQVCNYCYKHICNNGRYIKCNYCIKNFAHYDNVIGGCDANDLCIYKGPAVNKCRGCGKNWKLCVDDKLRHLLETDRDTGFSVVEGPCLKSGRVALTDDEIIADNKILIGILDRNLDEEHKAKIAREPENELDARVNLKSSNGDLDSRVSTDVRTKPSGGSKKRKNKTKRRRNKKTRRRRH